MKSYTITVNGTAYEVTVEETGSVSAPAAAPRQPHRSSSEGSTGTKGSSGRSSSRSRLC